MRNRIVIVVVISGIAAFYTALYLSGPRHDLTPQRYPYKYSFVTSFGCRVGRTTVGVVKQVGALASVPLILFVGSGLRPPIDRK